jgi:integrase
MPRSPHQRRARPITQTEVAPDDAAVVGPRPSRGGSDVASRLNDTRTRALLGHVVPTGEESRAGTADDELARLIREAGDIFAQSLADTTRASYARRWTAFTTWCEATGLSPLPAETTTLMLYLAGMARAEPPASISTLRGTAAAINRVHLEAGHTPPGNDPQVPVLFRGLSRILKRPTQRNRIDALRIEALRHVLGSMQEHDARLIRDVALLTLIGCGVSATASAGLKWSTIEFRAKTIRLTPVRGRTGPPAAAITLSGASAATARRALARWLDVAGTDPDWVFTATDALGRRSRTRPKPSDLQQAIDARLTSLGLDQDPAPWDEACRRLSNPDPFVVRDRAVLLLGFAGAFRRADLTRLTWSNLTDDTDGVIVHLTRSKTDLTGAGRDVGIPYGRSDLTCPVHALNAWRSTMRQHLGDAFTDDTPCFVGIHRAGGITQQALTPASISRIVVTRANAAGIPGHWGGRSLRAGFITTAADLGIPMEKIAEQSGHASMDNLAKYIRVLDPFSTSAASLIGL